MAMPHSAATARSTDPTAAGTRSKMLDRAFAVLETEGEKAIRVREGQADAWDEGREVGWDEIATRSAEPYLTDTPNPYRTEETDHA